MGERVRCAIPACSPRSGGALTPGFHGLQPAGGPSQAVGKGCYTELEAAPTIRPEVPITSHALILTAARFAAHKHRNQRRKGADQRPYIEHPIDVATTLATIGGVEDTEVLMAALLHDTVEDTECTFEEIEAEFGTDVASLVREVTDDKTLPSEQQKALQIEHARNISARAKLIRLGDKIGNVRDITTNPPASWSIQRRREYFAWTEQVVAGLRGTNPALEVMYDDVLARACRVIDELEALQQSS